MNKETQAFNHSETAEEREVCDFFANQIAQHLPEAKNKIWHGHPVWFLDGNPVTGYSKQKAGIRLMFWSGVSFDEEKLKPGTGKFKDASIFYTSAGQVDRDDLKRWLKKSHEIQWDYKNVVKRKGGAGTIEMITLCLKLTKGEWVIILADQVEIMAYAHLTGNQNCLITYCEAALKD